MREQASIIQAEVGKMMEDVLRLDQRVGKLESHFDQARRDIEQIRTSSTKILSRGEKIGELELEAVERGAEQVAPPPARKSVVLGKSGTVRVELGGRGLIKKNTTS